MNKFRKVLGMKIHRATVTHADLHYEGSLTVPGELMEAAGLVDYESVHVWNVTRGTRLETYAIRGSGPRDICANGAAAHHIRPGDLVIIASFVMVHEDDLPEHEPNIVFVDEENRVTRIGPEIPGPAVRG